MASTLPRFVVRASEDEISAWKEAAGGRSANEWAVAALNRAADGSEGEIVVTASAAAQRGRGAVRINCPRARFHRIGTYCKECGEVG